MLRRFRRLRWHRDHTGMILICRDWEGNHGRTMQELQALGSRFKHTELGDLSKTEDLAGEHENHVIRGRSATLQRELL